MEFVYIILFILCVFVIFYNKSFLKEKKNFQDVAEAVLKGSFLALSDCIGN